MDTTRANLSAEVGSEALWRHAREKTLLLAGWRARVFGAIAVAVAVTAGLWVLAKPDDVRTAMIATGATWLAMALAVGAELVVRRIQARAQILGHRLVVAADERQRLEHQLSAIKWERNAAYDRLCEVVRVGQHLISTHPVSPTDWEEWQQLREQYAVKFKALEGKLREHEWQRVAFVTYMQSPVLCPQPLNEKHNRWWSDIHAMLPHLQELQRVYAAPRSATTSSSPQT